MTAPGRHDPDLEELLAHRAWMHGLARRLARDEAGADDLLQDTWLRLLRRPPRGAAALRPWIATVMGNVARNFRRGETRRRARESRWTRLERPSEAEDGGRRSSALEEAEVGQHLRDALTRLSPEHREAIYQRFFCGLRPKEIAELRGEPAATVRSRVKRALDALRRDLDARAGGDRGAWCGALVAWASAGSDVAGDGTSVTPVTTSHTAAWTGALLAAGAVLVTTITLVHAEPESSGWSSPVSSAVPPAPAVELAGLDPAPATLVPVEAGGAPGSHSPSAPTAAGPTPVVLEVVDRRTSAPLPDVHVRVLPQRLVLARHPGLDDAASVIVASGRSPLELDREALQSHLGEGRIKVHVGAPGYAWTVARIDLRAKGGHLVSLVPEARLAARLSSDEAVDGLRLRLWDEARRGMVLQTPIGVLHGRRAIEVRGLPAGPLNLFLVHESEDGLHTVEEVEVALREGETRTVDIELPPLDPPAAVTVDGRLSLPAAYDGDHVSLELQRVDGPVRASDRPRVIALQPAPAHVAGVHVHRWSAPELAPGRYEVRVRPFDVIRGFVVDDVELGTDVVDILVEALALVDVSTVDAVSGEPVQLDRISWLREGDDRDARWGRETAARDPDTGRHTIVAEPGPIALSVESFSRGKDRVHGALRYELDAGRHFATLPLRRDIRLDVRLFDGETERPYDRGAYRIRVERIDGEGAMTFENLERRNALYVDEPGTYRISFDRADHYAIPDPVERELTAPGPHEHVVHLRRRR